MVEYVEIRNVNRDLIGIVDIAESVIWESVYYGVGQFEIYCKVTPLTVAMLSVGNYVTRPDNENVGVIENISITWETEAGRMIVASGRFAKSLLDRRLIYSLSGKSIAPTVSSGLVETAVRSLVNGNIIASGIASRNVPFIQLGELKNIDKTIVDENGNAARVQTSFGNLLEYTDSLLQAYNLGAYMSLDRQSKNLLYEVYEGVDRSMNNTAGNAPIIFSQDFDNLLSSDYLYESTALKTTALIGGEGEGVDRFCVMIGDEASGLSRREFFVDASSQSKKYKDSTETEKTYTDAEYTELLKSHGRQNMAQFQTMETFKGEIDVQNSNKVFGVDFGVGDIITIQDVELGTYINTRILKATEVQDANGYKLAVEYGV